MSQRKGNAPMFFFITYLLLLLIRILLLVNIIPLFAMEWIELTTLLVMSFHITVAEYNNIKLRKIVKDAVKL